MVTGSRSSSTATNHPSTTGVALMGLAWPFNLGALGNSLAIWLGISPWQLFFYGFLPPLLLDAAVRIDWYMFRKVGWPALMTEGTEEGCSGQQSSLSSKRMQRAANWHPTQPNPTLHPQVMVQVMTMAFLVVGASCALMVPIMLYLLGLKDKGWNWAHACMFGAIVASTDAVAIVSIMKTSEGLGWGGVGGVVGGCCSVGVAGGQLQPSCL